MLRARARAASRHDLAAIRHEFTHQVYILEINRHVQIRAKITNLASARFETSTFLERGAGA